MQSLPKKYTYWEPPYSRIQLLHLSTASLIIYLRRRVWREKSTLLQMQDDHIIRCNKNTEAHNYITFQDNEKGMASISSLHVHVAL